jgi:hypothetical protein
VQRMLPEETDGDQLEPQVWQLVEFLQVVQPSKVQEGEQVAVEPVPDLV